MKAFIFDLDGVLVFTDKFHYRAWKQVAEELGIYFDEKINQRLRGVSRMDSLEIILEKYEGKPLSMQEKEALADKKNAIYRELLSTMSPVDVAQEVREILEELHRRGYVLALGSSSKNAKYILEKVQLTTYLDVISDGTNISRSKPNPEVFLKAAEYMQIAPEECYVVEDAKAGIDAAKAGGMTAIGIADAAHYEKTDISIHRFMDLLLL